MLNPFVDSARYSRDILKYTLTQQYNGTRIGELGSSELRRKCVFNDASGGVIASRGWFFVTRPLFRLNTSEGSFEYGTMARRGPSPERPCDIARSSELRYRPVLRIPRNYELELEKFFFFFLVVSFIRCFFVILFILFFILFFL